MRTYAQPDHGVMGMHVLTHARTHLCGGVKASGRRSRVPIHSGSHIDSRQNVLVV